MGVKQTTANCVELITCEVLTRSKNGRRDSTEESYEMDIN